jgi:hypothetical protein
LSIEITIRYEINRRDNTYKTDKRYKRDKKDKKYKEDKKYKRYNLYDLISDPHIRVNSVVSKEIPHPPLRGPPSPRGEGCFPKNSGPLPVGEGERSDG